MIALFPGSFDPPTNGHIDCLKRAAALFERVFVAVLNNESKSTLFSVDERLLMLKQAAEPLRNVDVCAFDGLVADCARWCGAGCIVRGVRSSVDFEYEYHMSANNRLQGVETMFLPASPETAFMSSGRVKEIYRLGGSVERMVPPSVLDMLKKCKEG